jgi:hypothetical protein
VTVTADETAVDIAVDVRFNLAGKPLAVRYQGNIWPVAGTPTQWFGGKGYSRGSLRDNHPANSDSIEEVEYWRVQVRLGSNSAVRIFTLRRKHPSRQWFLETIAEGS